MPRASSRVSAGSSSSGMTNEPAAPPSRIVRRIARTPPASSSSSAAWCRSHLVDPGRRPPRDAEELRAGGALRRRARERAPPSSTIEHVVERLDVVDHRRLAEQARTTGNGGLLRGSPRKPSIERRARSPRRRCRRRRPSQLDVEGEASPITSSPRKPRARAASIAAQPAVASGYSPRM